MARIFVSYSRSDGDVVVPMCNALRANGFDVWLDQRDIPASVLWLAEIESALRGSALMLVVDSKYWQASENCQAELEIAHRWSVPVLRVAVASVLVSDIPGEVGAALARRSPDDASRTELFVRAGDWDDRQRPNGSLVSGRTLQGYSAAVRRAHIAMPDVVNQFLGASRRRQRRRTTLRRVGVLSAIAIVIGGIFTYSAIGLTNSGIDRAIASLDESTNYDVLYEMSPYAHLDHLAAAADNDGWLVDYQFARGLSALLPISVTPSDVPAVAARTAVSPDGLRSAELTDGPTVVIRRTDGGAIERVLTARGIPSTLSWSPNGQWVAVGVGAEVELLDAAHGTASQLLRGSKGLVLAITFDGEQLNAVTDAQLTVSWPVPYASAMAYGAGWIMDAEAVPGTDRVLLLERSGSLIDVPLGGAEANDGLPRIDVGFDEGVAAVAMAIHPSGEMVAVLGSGAGDAQLAVVNLVDGGAEMHTLYGCSGSDLTFDTSGSSVALACGLDGIGAFEVATSRQMVVPQRSGITAVTLFGPYIAAGTEFGQIALLDIRSLMPVDMGSSECAQDIRPLRATPDGRYLFHGGTGLASTGCALRVANDSDDSGAPAVHWHHLIFPDQDAHQSRAVAVSPNGQLVAFGFSDGTVHIYGTELIQPTAVLRPFAGEVRGLAFSADGSGLVIVTRDGDIAIESVAPAVEGLEAKRGKARDLVELAVQLG